MRNLINQYLNSKPEFSVGDRVTFDSYGDAIPAKVIEVLTGRGRPLNADRNDRRVFYRLEGVNPKKPLISICTGNSIAESVLFKSYAA